MLFAVMLKHLIDVIAVDTVRMSFGPKYLADNSNQSQLPRSIVTFPPLSVQLFREHGDSQQARHPIRRTARRLQAN